MDTSESDVTPADDSPGDVPRWWVMPYPTEPLYPVDLFISAKAAGRRRPRPQPEHARSRRAKRA